MVLGHGHVELVVGFDEGKHSVFIWSWILAVHVSLDTLIGRPCSFRKLLDQLIVG
jgi:hypothetical protein